jgi:uncharacterized protein YjbI with pentapeptide repeats
VADVLSRLLRYERAKLSRSMRLLFDGGEKFRMALEISTLAPDAAGENAPGNITLLDLAEILDQHKLWVESGGESGSKADLCSVNLANADLTGVNLQGAFLHKANLSGADLSMANLRGASLVQADLRNTNLLGTELRGANLMAATLYGAEGLWVGRLGGTNLFDALLPESISAFDGPKAIADATKVARWFYFSMLAISLLCCGLIAFTTDLRLVLNASAIPISRFGNVLPMTGFYMGAPLLLLVIYLRFHFLLLRLWGSMAALPAVFPDGQTPENDGPWYLMGLVRRHFRWARDNRSPFVVLETVLSTLLAYWAVPATVFFFWLRYLVRQDLRGTLLHVFLLTLSVAVATCLPVVISRVLRPGEIRHPQSKNVLRIVLLSMRGALATGLALLLLSVGVLHGLPADRNIASGYSAANVRRWAAQAFQAVGYRPYADLTEAALSQMPSRQNWSEEALAAVPGAKLNQTSLRFARAYRAFLVNGRLWRTDFEGAYLSEADLRGANLREAVLHNAVFDRVQASKAVMVSADATGANVTGANLVAADLSYGTFENAVLSNAHLAGASVYGANLRNAQLLRADLSRADLRDTKLEHAVLTLANLQETDLSSAKLSEANLTGAQLHGTILLDADLKKADLRGAFLTGAIVRGAEFDGANIAGADLRGAVGITSLQICSAARWRAALLDAEMYVEVQTRCGGQ